MNLSELTPSSVEFTVLGIDLTLRPFTIADDIMAAKACGGQEEMVKAFQEFDFEKISLISWYQLDLESQKKVLSAVSGSYIDPETGEEIDAKLKPIDKYRKLFLGMEGQISMIVNMIKCKGINIPDLNDEAELKKWMDQLQPATPSTGP